MSEYVLEVNNLTKRFDDAGGNEVLTDLSLQVKKREFLCILGPSGCGKTTLLRCIAGFEQCQGEILVNGTRTLQPGTDRIMVFQDFDQLFPWKTVEANVEYPLKLNGVADKTKRREMAGEALAKVNLAGYEKYYPHQLSGGMKQRVAIAKALALKPQIILMDEPFAALDAMTRRDLQNEMLRISEVEDCTVIFITHNIQEAIILGTRILVLQRAGKIVYDKPNRLTKPITPESKEFSALWGDLHRALYSSAQAGETDPAAAGTVSAGDFGGGRYTG